MNKLIFLIVWTVAFTVNAGAQLTCSIDELNISGSALIDELNVPVINSSEATSDIVAVINVKGKVKYRKPGSRRYKKLKEGSVIAAKGKVKVKRRAALDLLKDGKMHSFNSKGKIKLSELESTVEGDVMTTRSAISSEDDFLSFLSSASGFGAGGPGRGSGGQIDTSSNSDGGYLNVTKKLKCLSPAGGLVPHKEVKFQWGGKSETGYLIKIFDGNNVIFSKEVMEKNMRIDLKSIEALEVGKEYQWEVSEEKQPGIFKRSKRVRFTIVNADKPNEVLKELQQLETLDPATSWKDALRVAQVLQSANLLSEADAKFEQAMIDFPDNEVVVYSYNYFRDSVVN